jgi:hypothetical protein
VIDGQLIDDVVNTFIDWRQQSECVWRTSPIPSPSQLDELFRPA